MNDNDSLRQKEPECEFGSTEEGGHSWWTVLINTRNVPLCCSSCSSFVWLVSQVRLSAGTEERRARGGSGNKRYSRAEQNRKFETLTRVSELSPTHPRPNLSWFSLSSCARVCKLTFGELRRHGWPERTECVFLEEFALAAVCFLLREPSGVSSGPNLWVPLSEEDSVPAAPDRPAAFLYFKCVSS